MIRLVFYRLLESATFSVLFYALSLSERAFKKTLKQIVQTIQDKAFSESFIDRAEAGFREEAVFFAVQTGRIHLLNFFFNHALANGGILSLIHI